MRFSIRRKMFLGLMVVVITFVVAVNLIMHYLLGDIAHREIVRGLENSIVAYHRFDEQRKELMLTQANSMAQTAHLKATLTIPDVDTETVYYAGVGLRDITHPELMLIISASGELLSDINSPESTPKPLIGLPGIEQALNGSHYYGIWEYDQHSFLVAISPSFFGEQVVGLIVIGQRLDGVDAIKLAEEVTGAQVILSVNEKVFPVASHKLQNGKKTTDLQALFLAAQTGETVENKLGAELTKVSFDGDSYYTATILHQDVPGATMLYRSSGLMASSVDPVRLIILVTSSLTLLFGMLLSLRMSSQISKPIVKLTEAAQEYGKGNFDLRIKPGPKDEVGELTVAFNSMADHIISNRQNLLESIEAAEAASRAKSTFLATMSHEIRTPLNGVLGMADLLANTELDSRQAGLVNTINKSGQNLLDIINEILDFSKIEAGKFELNFRTFKLRELIENIGRLHANSVQKKGLEFVCSIPPEVSLLVEGDDVRLGQVLTNLIGNAIKFTENGFIEVRVDVLEKANTKAQLRFEVTDTGIGINQDKLDTIFQSFTQADGSTTRKFGGTGLGLAISQQLVEMMGGNIQVTSKIGKGTRFYFDLTLAAMDLPDEDHCESSLNLAGKRVLIVDDVATNRELLQQQLSTWGISCDSVASGREALEAIRHAEAVENPYELALLDYNMPEMDGLELAEAINNQAKTKKIHLALLSCASENDKEQRSKDLGMSVFLSKPVRQSDLYDGLATMVSDETEANPNNSLPIKSALKVPLPQQINARILVSEDTLVNQQVVATMLEWFGCDFVIASDGAEAQKLITEELFDVILMDCQMPIMDGFEATINIRKFEKTTGQTRVPIIALTANAIDGDRDHCLKVGMDDYMSKPFNQQQLKEMLLKWVAPQDDLHNQTADKSTSLQLTPNSTLNPIVNKTSAFDSTASDQHTNLKLVDKLEIIESETIFDATVLDQFRQLQKSGREDVVARLKEAFLADSPKHIQDLLEAAKLNDPEALYKSAHALKSSSTNMGAKRLSMTCKIVEEIGRSGTTEGADSLLAIVPTLYEETTDCLIEQQAMAVS